MGGGKAGTGKRAVSVDRQGTIHSSGNPVSSGGMTHPRAVALRALEGYNNQLLSPTGADESSQFTSKFHMKQGSFRNGMAAQGLEPFQSGTMPRSQDGNQLRPLVANAFGQQAVSPSGGLDMNNASFSQ